VLEYPVGLSPEAKARIELALQAAEQAFSVVPGNAVVVTEDFLGRVIVIDRFSTDSIQRLRLDYPSDRAAVQFVIDVFGTVVQVFGETWRARPLWSAGDFRSWSERWCDDLAARAYQQNDVKSGVARREPLEAFVARVRRALVAAPCWAQYQEILDTLSTIQATPLSHGQQLRALLTETGWTVEKLAEKAQLDRSSVLDHLSDKAKLQSSTRQQYEKAFSDALDRPVTLDG
jgi:hypothetical protein